MEAKKTKLLPLLTGGFLCFLLCILGLIRDPNILDTGHVPRLLVLSAGLLIVLMVFLLPPIRMILNWLTLENRVIYAYVAYLCSVWVSLLFALNPSAGLLDACTSGAALVAFCMCLILFASCPMWRLWLAKSSALSGLTFVTVGHFECWQYSVWHTPTRATAEQVTGFMGNVNFFVGYLAILFPLCVVAGLVLRGAWRWISWAVAANLVILILILQGRTAWLGVISSLIVFMLAASSRPKIFGFSNKLKYKILGVVLALLVFMAFFLKFAPTDNPFAFRLRSVFADDVRFSDGGRLMIWKETIRMFIDHFPYGVGAGNFPIHLQFYREAGRLDFSKVDSGWNEPHNDYLWILTEKGVLGLGTYLLVLILAFSSAIRVIYQSQDYEEICITVGALASFTAYLVESFFSFPLERVSHQAALSVVLAAMVARSSSKASENLDRLGLRIPIFAASAIFLLGAGISIAGISWNQEHHVALARKAMERGHWNSMQKHAHLARTPLRTLDTYAVPVSFLEGFAWMKKGDFNAATSLFELAEMESPSRFYTLNNLAVMYDARGEKQKAGEILQRLHRLYPEESEVSCNLAMFLLDEGKNDQALQVIKDIPKEKIPHSVLQKFSIPSAGKPD